jgi:hypothetical protein
MAKNERSVPSAHNLERILKFLSRDDYTIADGTNCRRIAPPPVEPHEGMLRSLVLALALAEAALGYVDPGTTGMVFQFGYVLFYGFMAGLAFMLRPLKDFFLMLKGRSRKAAPEPRTAGEENQSEGPTQSD